MTTKHTPGPWIISDKSMGTVPPEEDIPNNKGWDFQSRFIKTESGAILGQTMSYTTDLFINDFEQEEANAHLIAAAPENTESNIYMTSVVEKCIKVINDYLPSPMMSKEDTLNAIIGILDNAEIVEKLKASKSAIAKATNQKEEAI